MPQKNFSENKTIKNDNNQLMNLSSLGLIKVSGSDAATFLQGQLTCDVRQVSPHHTALAAFCNPQGRVIALFFLIQWLDDYYLCMPQAIIPETLERLNKYALFSKVTLSIAQSISIFGLIVSEIDSLINLPDELYVQSMENDYCCIKVPGVNRYMLFLQNETTQPITQTLNQICELLPASNWEKLNIQAGLPSIHPQTQEKFIASRLNLDDLKAISYEKGCYVGQEIIARLHYRGTLKHRMYYYQIISPVALEPGMDLMQNNHVVGSLVDVVHCADNQYDCLLVVINELAMQLSSASIDGVTVNLMLKELEY